MVELPIGKKNEQLGRPEQKRPKQLLPKEAGLTSRFLKSANFKVYKSCQGGVTPIEAHSRHPLRWNVAHPETPIHPGLAVLDINAVTDSEGGPG